MAIIAGMDEAGYGPVLGPMVVTAVAFEVPEEKVHRSLWAVLKTAISQGSGNKGFRLVVQDSKKVYRAHGDLKLLENVVLCFLRARGARIASLSHLLKSLSCYRPDTLAGYPWYAGKDCPLPVATNNSAVLNYADLLQCAMDEAGMRFLGANSYVLAVGEFNTQVRSYGNKAAVLFKICADVMSVLWRNYGMVRLVVDKQGGRSHYADLLTGYFPGIDVKTIRENARVSEYEMVNTQRKMNVFFRANGDEQYMEVALASMFSKYIRELFMRLENQYWQQFVQNLRPTAGYYTDAMRFLKEIDPVIKEKAIPYDILIRVK